MVSGVGDWCQRHGVDAWFMPSTTVTTPELRTAKRSPASPRKNAFPAVADDWGASIADLVRLGAPGQLVHLDRDAVQQRCASPAFGNGVFMPSAATVQPALLARGLRRVLLERVEVLQEQEP